MAYKSSAGSKLEYSTTQGGTYTKINGLLGIPAIGETPNKIATTTLDNLTYETEIDGLFPAVSLEFEFNLETPAALANISAVSALDSDTNYYWKITLSSGITHEFQSKVKIGYREVGIDEIEGFTLFLSPLGEITTTVPPISG